MSPQWRHGFLTADQGIMRWILLVWGAVPFPSTQSGTFGLYGSQWGPPNGMRIILVANFWVCFSRLRRYSCFEHISEDCGTSQSRATFYCSKPLKWRFPNSWYPQITQIGPLKTMDSHGDDWGSPRKWQDGRVLCPPPNIGVLGATVVKTSRIFNYKTGLVWFPK